MRVERQRTADRVLQAPGLPVPALAALVDALGPHAAAAFSGPPTSPLVTSAMSVPGSPPEAPHPGDGAHPSGCPADPMSAEAEFAVIGALLARGPAWVARLSEEAAEQAIGVTQRALARVAAVQAAALTAYGRAVEAAFADDADADVLRAGARAPIASPVEIERAAAAGAATLLHVAPRTASSVLGRSRSLVERLPLTTQKAWAGELGATRCAIVVSASAAVALDRVVDFDVALHEGDGVARLPNARLRARAERVAARVDPEGVRDAAVGERAARFVRVEPGSAMGTTWWTASQPSETSAAAWAAIDGLATDYLRANPGLAVEAARADAMMDLLLRNVEVSTTVVLGVTGGLEPAVSDPATRRAIARAASVAADLPADQAGDYAEAPVNDGLVWCRADCPDRPGEGDGAGSAAGSAATPEPAATSEPAATPEPAEQSRREPCPHWHPRGPGDPAGAHAVRAGRVGWVLADAVASLLAHPDTRIRLARLDATTGAVAALDTQVYRPGQALARAVRARDHTCRFPGCATAAERCDLDHVVPWPSGPTTADNLVTLCRTHHRLKHRLRWRLELEPDGRAVWTSPTGRRLQTHPMPLTDLVA